MADSGKGELSINTIPRPDKEAMPIGVPLDPSFLGAVALAMVSEQLRAQIDAIKRHLEAGGLTQVDDPPEVQRPPGPGYHTIRAALPQVPATRHEHFRFLSVHYNWLQNLATPENTLLWLDRQRIAHRLRTNEREIYVDEHGQITSIRL